MKAYIITMEDLNDYTTTIISVYSKKDKAKEQVDRLNKLSSEDENVEYRIQSFEMDTEETYD